MNNYTFTREQLNNLLSATIDMHIEYRDVHGHQELDAQILAVGEMLEGLDAERELVEAGECKATMQVLLAKDGE
jgi:hypothetical protein